MNKIIQGDCIEVMKTMEENSVDTVITDPPYGIGFMGEEWDTFTPEYIDKGVKANLGNGSKDARGRNDTSPAWVSARYDKSYKGQVDFQKWTEEWATEALRVAKPGAIMLVFGGTRTFHRMACGIEDAGWEIRDCLMWLYGSGFPKSLNIGKAIDKIDGELGRMEKFTAWMRTTGITASQIDRITNTGNYILNYPIIPPCRFFTK